MEFNNHCEPRNNTEGTSIKKKKISNENSEELKVNEFDKLNDDCLTHIFLFLTNLERIRIELGKIADNILFIS